MNIREVISVAVYCRVSTQSDEQATSFENQVTFFRAYVKSHPEWQLYEIYTDEGITGTSVKKREGFLHMIRDAERGCFSLLLTKEISRFARNLLDSISYTRHLKKLGCGVYFLSDGIDTRDGDAELRLAILASIAQEESRRTSERVKWGQKRRMEAGVVFGRALFGYDLIDGKLYVKEAEAETVRYIFRAFLSENKTPADIARMLDHEGIHPARADAWRSSVITRMLQNEKYCGDLVQKKTMTTDYLTHEKKYNRGEEALVILRDHHAPIISREDFEAVQARLAERKQAPRKKHSSRYPLSGKVICGFCGRPMTARVQERRGGTYHLWRCSRGHRSNSIRNEDIFLMIRQASASFPSETEEAKRQAKTALLRYLTSFCSVEKLEDAKERLLSLYLMGEMEQKPYLAEKRRLETEATRILHVSEAIETAVYEESYLEFLTERVTVWEEKAVLQFRSATRRWGFAIHSFGRRHEIEAIPDCFSLCGIDSRENL